MLTTKYTPPPREDYPDPDQSEARYLALCVGLIALLLACTVLVALAVARWWPWLLG